MNLYSYKIAALVTCLCGFNLFAARPNIIVIMTDDSGYTDLGCYGGEIDTPHLDSLAQQGMRFKNFYNEGRCSPTRATLMTGHDAADVGFGAGTLGGHPTINNPGYFGILPYTVPTVAELMRDAGYQTLMVGKWHLGGTYDIKTNNQAQQHWKNHRHPDRELTEEAMDDEYNALPSERGFNQYFGLVSGESHLFDTEDDGWQHRIMDGNQPAGELPITGTYTMNCFWEEGKEESKAYPYTTNHGKTAPAYYATDGITDRAIRMIQETNDAGDQPYFLYVAHRAPHLPLQAPQELVDKYMSRYADFSEVEADRAAGVVREQLFPEDAAFRFEFGPGREIPAETKQELQLKYALHAAMMEKIDDNVGKLVAALKDTGEFDNTLIFYFSDNGAASHVGDMMNSPYYGSKARLWEGGTKTHCIASWPNEIAPGTITDSVGWVGDILPTCLELAETTYPENFRGVETSPPEGRSIVPVLKGQELAPPEYLFTNDKGQQGVIFEGRWKLLIEPGWYFQTTEVSGTVYELYNLENDPAEKTNLVEENPDLVEQLKTACENWQSKCNIIDYGEYLEILDNAKKGERKLLTPTTTYDGSGVLTSAANWDNGVPTDLAPGLVNATDASSTLATWRGVAVRQTGGTLAALEHRLEAGNDLISESTQSILELDDSLNWNGTGYDYKNLDFAKLVMWDRNVAGNKNTFSVLNGYADVGELGVTSTAANTINIGDGRLDVNKFLNARVTVNMLDGGTGEFNLTDMYGTAEAKSKLDQMILNFETGSSASFTIASNNGVSAGDAWETKIADGQVKIDGTTVSDTDQFVIANVGATGTKISLVQLDRDPPTPNPATFSSAPSAAGIAISMTATTGTDASGPVEYYFAETSGNPGGDDSGWQTSPSYTDEGLDEHTQYSYTVQMRDSATTPNVGAASSSFSVTTGVYTPVYYFIAPDGSDATGDGSIANPYETITKAQSVASYGDTVYLRGGTYTLDNSDITYSHSAWDSVNHITKDGIRYIAYADEVPIFDFSDVKPVGRRVTAFLVEADNCVFEGFEVVGVQVTIAAGEANNTQSECFRIVGGNNNRFERLSMHDGMGIGWYLTSGGGNLVINCDAYNNKGLDRLSHGNIDGFGAHTNRTSDTGNTFIGCRAWFNSDDGFDLINNDAAVVISNCWAMYNGYDHESPSSMIGDSVGFKAGGYGVKGNWYPTPVPRNRVLYCLAVENGRGFYANHHPGGMDWIGNTAIYNGTNYNMLGNLDARSTDQDVPGFDHYMKNNLGFDGSTEVSDLGTDPASNNDVTYNYWTLPVTVTADDFKSLSYALLTQARQADGSLPNVDYARLVEGSDLIDVGTTNLVGGIPYYSGSAPDLGFLEFGLGDYGTWAGNFTGSDLNDSAADFDGDGVANLMEYALGGNPTDKDAATVRPDFQLSNDYVIHTHNERTDDPSLTYTVEWTDDLVNASGVMGWATDGVEFVDESVHSNALKTVTNRIPSSGKDQQFIRLKIEQE